MVRALVVAMATLHVTGCELVFPLRDGPGLVADAADGKDAALGDSFVPSDTNNTCAGSPSLFDDWVFTTATLPYSGPGGVDGFALYQASGAVHAIVTNVDSVLDVSSTGAATPLTSLDPPSAASVSTPRVTPDGSMVWYLQTGIAQGVYFATRASGWIKQRADLGFVDAERIEPGGPAFFAGSLRMVVGVRDVGGPSKLFELASVDGEQWTQLDTIKFASSASGDFHPTLTSDGCHLVFTGSDGTNRIHVAAREADGTFTTANILANVSSITSAPSFPVVSPARDQLWFSAIVGADLTRYRGGPP